MNEKIDLIQSTEKAVLSFHPAIQRIDSSEYEDGELSYWLADSYGTLRREKGTYCSISTSAVAKRGEERRSGYGADMQPAWEKLDGSRAAEMAAQQAVRLLGAREIPSGMMDLVLSPKVARQLFSIIGMCFSGEAVRKHKSFLEGKLGQTVASAQLTLIDDGTLQDRMGTARWDGEGEEQQRTVLLQNGVMQSYLLDRTSAMALGMTSTGNGIRKGYQAMPAVAFTNFYVAPGNSTPEELLQDTRECIYVTDIMGAHTANPISGNVSLGISGIYYQNGREAYPVHRATIAGNMAEFLQKVDGLGNDLTFLGTKGAPTIRIRDIMVSGI